MKSFATLALSAGFAISAQAQDMDGFAKGPVFADYGAHTSIDSDMPIPVGETFKIAFDASKEAEDGKVNRSFESLARFINMHVAAGVPIERIHLAIVLHGGAVQDVLNAEAYAKRHDGKASASADLVQQLLDHDVQFIVCGQSAAASGIAKSDLMPGVKMALSAMTAHALLQHQGYTENPF